MKRLSTRLRMRLAMLRKGVSYSDEFVRRVYSIYLNHSKVIGYSNGCPMFSLSTPPLYSKPSANFFARLIYRVIQNRPTPNLMSFAVNDECNAFCEHCSFFTSVDDKKKQLLSLEEAQRVVREAQDLGVSVINFVGGEPLLRKDLPDIIRAIDRDRSISTLFTNGKLLKDRAQELKDAGLDSVYVSIDSATPDMHNTIRRTPGLFDDAMVGIDIAKKVGLQVGMSCVVDELRFRDGELDRLVNLAKDMGLLEVVVFDALPAGRYKDKPELKGKRGWVEEMIDSIKKYNDDTRFPGVLAYSYTSSFRSVGCSCGTSYFYMSPYGELMPCDFLHTRFGSIREHSLAELWDTISSSEGFGTASWTGCRTGKIPDGTTETPSDGRTCQAGNCSGCRT